MELQREASSLPARRIVDDGGEQHHTSPGTVPLSRHLISTALGWSVILQMHWLHRSGHKCGESCHCDDHF